MHVVWSACCTPCIACCVLCVAACCRLSGSHCRLHMCAVRVACCRVRVALKKGWVFLSQHLMGTQGYSRRADRYSAVLEGYSRRTRGVLTGYSRGTHGVLKGYSRGYSDPAALQGREADVVVVSFVRARDGRAALADGGVGFLQVGVRPCLASTHEYPASTPGLRSARRTCGG